MLVLLAKALRACRLLLFGPHSTIPIQTLCLVVLFVAFYVAQRVLGGAGVSLDICLAPSHVTARIEWTELAKRWFFHSLLHADNPSHIVMNMLALARSGQYLERHQESLLGEEGFLALVLFLWTVLPVFSFLIATGLKLAVDGCAIGFSGILYGFLSVELYLEYQKAGWTWRMSQELLCSIFAPILIEALEENLPISHLVHAAGFVAGLVYIVILHVYSSPPRQTRKGLERTSAWKERMVRSGEFKISRTREEQEKAKIQLAAIERRRPKKRPRASRRPPPPTPSTMAPLTGEQKREIQLRAIEGRPPIPSISTLPARTIVLQSEYRSPSPPPSSLQVPPPPPLPIPPPPTEASHMEQDPQVASGSTTTDQANDKEKDLADSMDVVKENKRKRTDEDEVEKDEVALKISKPSSKK